jgi:hypothetical protein
MATHARRCIEAMDKQRQDITMLWWLKRPDWLKQFRMGLELLDWAGNTMSVPHSVSKGEEFQGEVTKEFERRKVSPVAPERVVSSWQKNTAKGLCLIARWPKPFFPVMLQTRPGPDQTGSGCFIVFSSWQDAVIALRDIAKTRTYRRYAASMVYENQLVDMAGYDFPCRIILDCDAKEAQFGGQYTLEQLGECISRVPEWFARRMVEIGAIKADDLVVVYEKEKSRRGKASRHYVFNIVGLSTWDTRAILWEIFGKEIELRKEEEKKAKAKGQQLLTGSPEPWEVTDPVPHHGRGQYSVLGFYDTTKGETEFPAITKRFEIRAGKVLKTHPCKIARADSSLKHPLAMQLLHRACYSCPVDDFITMNPKFMTQKQVSEKYLEQSLP